MWAPPATREPADLADALRRQLRDLGARPWQVELVTGALTGAVLLGDVEPPAATEDELLDDGADEDPDVEVETDQPG
jgi:ribonuclease D